jgi:hypothetical protein
MQQSTATTGHNTPARNPFLPKGIGICTARGYSRCAGLRRAGSSRAPRRGGFQTRPYRRLSRAHPRKRHLCETATWIAAPLCPSQCRAFWGLRKKSSPAFPNPPLLCRYLCPKGEGIKMRDASCAPWKERRSNPRHCPSFVIARRRVTRQSAYPFRKDAVFPGCAGRRLAGVVARGITVCAVCRGGFETRPHAAHGTKQQAEGPRPQNIRPLCRDRCFRGRTSEGSLRRFLIRIRILKDGLTCWRF